MSARSCGWPRPSLIAGLVLAGLLLPASLPASAGEPAIPPQTRLRLSVVQWNPAKGDFQEWQTIGGEFVVSPAGTLQLPVVGPVTVGSLDKTALADEIAARLQSVMGLVNKPEASVEIVEYPPVYAVGDVTNPGEYKFRTGMTVLQVLAMSGGPFRSAQDGVEGPIKLVGELQALRGQVLRSRARIARLKAEMAGAGEIEFPQVPPGDVDAGTAREIFSQERIIFLARANELTRQTKSLDELRGILQAEIGVLEQKIKVAEIGIKNAQDELQSVTVLVEKGIAVASRRSDLERSLASFQADRLDQVTAVMRARQNITEATRNLEGLQDRRQTEVASELQAEQANLEQLLLKQDVSQKLLLDALSSGDALVGQAAPRLSYTVTRAADGQMHDMPAADTTLLQPGDVVRVTVEKMLPEKERAASEIVGSISPSDIGGGKAIRDANR